MEGDLNAIKNHLSSSNSLINSVDEHGRNCLLFCIENNLIEAAKYFIEANIDINHQDKEKKSALHELCN